ncbi:MAG: molybdenum cofactor biosynthesis protein MoaE [Acidimicrobiales bacterium]|nr:molybdenum cofactor biosynthesis protein MoaE [Acidimicrobiales bacterium]MCB9396097.1 molybdenum cofactor biosynthesis protein MoaE [Acidimicrobiaceae bacterium]
MSRSAHGASPREAGPEIPRPGRRTLDRSGIATATLPPVQPPEHRDTWVELSTCELPVAAAYDWAVLPTCGAVVLFSGTVRDHAVDDGGVMRTDVVHLEYEAYTEQCVGVFEKIVQELRTRWPHTGRVAVLHRLGLIGLAESSVVVVVSAPHRPEAFEAARYAIDALKASAPIWKHETWRDGDDGDGSGWGTNAHVPVDPTTVPTVRGS